jgi:hypothetical protein
MDPQQTQSPSSSASSTTTTRGTFGHLLRDRGVRFAAGLAVVVAIPVAVLFYFQFRSLHDLEETSAVVLRQLSGDTAESLAREIEVSLKQPHIDLLLRPGREARLNPPDFTWLGTVFAEGMAASAFIEELWFWSETAEGYEDRFFVFGRAGGPAPVAGMDPRFQESPKRYAQIVEKARQLGAERRAIVAFPMVIDGRRKYVQLQLGFEGPNRERVTRLLGFITDEEADRLPSARAVYGGWRRQAHHGIGRAPLVFGVRGRTHVPARVLRSRVARIRRAL